MDVLIAPRTGLRLPSPVIAASGTFGYGLEYAKRMDLSGLGAVVCKGTTMEPSTGNEPPRLVETPAGMLNSIGLQNVGLTRLIEEKAPVWATWPIPVLVNVSATSIVEFRGIVAQLDKAPGVSGIELNLSCPNVKEGGVAFGLDPEVAGEVTRAVRDATSLPLVVKLSPNVSVPVLEEIARAVEAAGADAISLINTLYGMAIDRSRKRPIIPGVYGGLSGPAIKPVALYLVFRVAQVVTLPIIGLGGILSTEDAIDFLMAGASAVGLGTALLLDPGCWRTVATGLKHWLDREGVADLDAVVGCANPQFLGPRSRHR